MIDSLYVFYENITAFWKGSVLPYLPLIKVISFIIIVILAFDIIILLLRMGKFTTEMRKFFKGTALKTIPKGQILRQWQMITQKAHSNNSNDRKISIIEADKLLDDILQQIGYKGETMAERLKKLVPFKYAYLDDVWFAHKIRNRIAHEPDYEVDEFTTRKCIEGYEKFFKELELI